MDVSVIIVNYNTSKLTCQTLGSVITQTRGLTYEIIVVDNNSSDTSVSDIQSTFGEKVKLITLAENIGFGRANNCGIECCNGQNILFLNPDTILIDNPIKVLNDYLNNHIEVGAVGGNLYTEQMNPAHSFERHALSISNQLNELFLSIPYRLRYGRNYSFNKTNHPLKVAQIVGADMMVRKTILDGIGSFDPAFFMYREESELCHRIIKAGYQLHVLPNARIIHLEGQSFNVKETRELMWLDGTKIYMLKTHSALYYTIYAYLYLITIYVHSFKCFILGKKEQRELWKAKLQHVRKFNSNNNR